MAMTVSKSGGRSYRRRRSTGSSFTEINVTPLVDVMLVLLIIFMVAAPMLTVGVPVDLPKTHAAKLNDQIEPVVVSVDAQGQSFLQETALEGEELIARLMAVTGSNPEARIFVRGDKAIHYGRVMEIMGQIAAAGFNKVSLIAEMPTTPPPSAVKLPPAPPAGLSAPQAPKPAPVAAPQAAPRGPVAPKAQPIARPQAPSGQGPNAAGNRGLPKPSGQPVKTAPKAAANQQPAVKRGQ